MELSARAAASGIVLAAPGEEADLVAYPAARPPREPPTGRPAMGGAAAAPPGRAAAGPLSPRLSPRELEILEYLADGWSNAEIASVLGLGVRTVRFHLESLFSKLGVSRRGEAVREAARLGLVRFEF